MTGLIQNTIQCVTLAGSGGVIDDDLVMNPMLIFYSHFYFIENINTETEVEVKW
jgi:hypothetical protein